MQRSLYVIRVVILMMLVSTLSLSQGGGQGGGGGPSGGGGGGITPPAGDIGGTTVSPLVTSIQGTPVTITPPWALGDVLCYDGVALTPCPPTAGTPTILYDTGTASADIGGYNLEDITPSGSPFNVPVTIPATSVKTLIQPFATASAVPGVNVIPAGDWQADTYIQVSSGANTTTLQVDVYKRNLAGTETLLFSFPDQTISGKGTAIQTASIAVVEPAFPLLVTDRIVAKYSATKTGGASITATLYGGGTTNYSHIHTPLGTASGSSSAVSISAALACISASGSGTAYTCTTTPTFTPADDVIILLEADVASGVSPTLNVNGSGPAPLKRQGCSVNLTTNDLLAGQDTLFTYDGANWCMQGQTGNASTQAAIMPNTAPASTQIPVGNGSAYVPTYPGFKGRAVTGTTSTDTILAADNVLPVMYQGSVAVAVTLPTATTLGISGFAVQLVNNTSGSSTAVTVTPTTWTVNGGASLVIAQGQSCKVYVDPSGTNWDAECHDLPWTAGTGVSIARGQYGPTINNTGAPAPTTVVHASGSPYTMTGATGFYWNNTASTYNWVLDVPTAGKQYCFGNYSARTGALTITSTTSVYIVYKGANGTVTTGTLVSGGAAGDFICLVGVDSTHYAAAGAGMGTWVNN